MKQSKFFCKYLVLKFNFRHCVLKTTHPSGLSAHKGFSSAYHFSKVNELLKKNGKEEIDWNLNQNKYIIYFLKIRFDNDESKLK